MKKIVLLLLLLPICIGRVFASEVYYSEYSKFSDWQEERVLSSDTTYVEEEKRYKWYQKEEVPGDYALYDSNGNFSDDCYMTDLTEWTTERPPTHESRVISSRYQYTYQISKDVRYIHLKNFSGSDVFRIAELRAYISSTEMKYKYTCEGCSSNFGSVIRDGNKDDVAYIENNGELVIDIGNIYPIHYLRLELSLYDTGTNNKNYTIGFSNDKENIFVEKDISLSFTNTPGQTEDITHTIWNLNVADSDWSTFDVTYEPYIDRTQASTKVVEEFAYTEKMCRVINEDRTYIDDYYKDQPQNYPFRDEEQSKTYYRFKTRNRLELSDHLVITDKNFDLSDLVIDSTLPFTIDGKVDLNNNGNYPITITSDSITVQKELSVQIIQNEINKYETEIAKMRQTLEQLQQSWNQEKEQYELKIDALNKQLITCAEEKEYLQELINQKDKALKEYEKNILYLSNQINQIQVQLQAKQSELEQLKHQKKIDQDKIVDLEKKLEELTHQGANLNQDIAKDYQTQLEGKDRLLKAYLLKIQQLTNQLHTVHQNVQVIIEQRDAYQQENEQLQRQLEEYKNNSNQCSDIQQELEISKQEKENLNQKLNNYILKIRGENKLSLLWFYIICVILFVSTVIYRLRKKSNVK